MHDPKTVGLFGLGGLVTLLGGWKIADVVRAMLAGGGKLIDSTTARRQVAINEKKLEVDAEAARERLETERATARETLLSQEAEHLRTASRELMEEQRKSHAEFKEEVRAQIKQLKEDVGQAAVFAAVANENAADREAEARKLRAEKSLCDMEIASLLQQLLESENEKKQIRTRSEEEKRTLLEQIATLQSRSTELERQIAHMTAIVLHKHPEASSYPEALSSAESLEYYLLHRPATEQEKP